MKGFGEEPVPSRWVTLPGDPPVLRAWLAVQAGDETPDDWPQKEP